MHICMVDLKRYRATSGERNFIERIKIPIFLEVVLERDNLKAPIQLNPSILEDDFSSRTDPSILTSLAPVLLHWSNKTR